MHQTPEAATVDSHTSAFRPDIQGLRAVAVLIVVIYHVGFVSGGYIGVDVFFVLSGFLMGGLLLREAQLTGRVRLWSFFSRRGKRLLPALAVTTTVTILLAAVIGPFGDVLDATTSTASATSTFFANIRLYNLSGNYFAGATESNPLLHTWSLSVEEQFYFGLPVLLLLLCAVLYRRRAALTRWFVTSMAVLAAASFVLNILMVDRHWRVHGIWQPQQFAFFNPLTRIWEFGAGVLLAAWAARGSRGASSARSVLPARLRQVLAATAFGAVIVATVLYGKDTAFPGAAATVPVAATVLLLAYGRDLTPLRRLLEWRPTVRLGDLSYGWYLWHWPLIVFARYRWGDNRLALSLAALGALVLAALSYRLVEEPFRRNKRITGVWAASLIVVCIGVPYGLGRVVARVNLREWTEQHRTYLLGPNPDVQPNEASVAANGGRLQVHFSPSGPDAASAPRVVLLGDSHARGMTKAFGDRFAPGGVEFESIFKNGCNLMSGPTPDPEACLAWQQRSLEKLLADPPDAVILAGYITGRVTGTKRGLDSWFWMHDEQGVRAQSAQEALALYERGLGNVVNALNKVGTTVIVMSSVPDFPGGPFDDTSLLDELVDSVHPTVRHQSLEAARQRAGSVLAVERRLASSAERMLVVDPLPLLCGTDCAQAMDGKLLYLDTDHLTYDGAMRLADGLLPILKALG